MPPTRSILKKSRRHSNGSGGRRSPSPSSSPESKGKYLFPLKPRMRLVKFRSEESLAKIYETHAGDVYNRTPHPIPRLGPLPPDNDRVILNPGPVVQRPRMTRTHALTGEAMRAALDGVEYTGPSFAPDPSMHKHEFPQWLPTDDPVDEASTALLDALKTENWLAAEKLSAVCTDTSVTDFAPEHDNSLFEKYFYECRSDDNLGEDRVTDISAPPSPHTPPDDTAILFGNGRTVRYVPPSTTDDEEDALPLEGRGLIDFDRDFDDSEVITSLSDLHMAYFTASSSSSSSSQSTTSGSLPRRWPSSRPAREPTRFFAQRHHVQRFDTTAKLNEDLYPEINLSDSEDEADCESSETVSTMMSFSQRITSSRQQKKMQHCIDNSPFGSPSKATSQELPAADEDEA